MSRDFGRVTGAEWMRLYFAARDVQEGCTIQNLEDSIGEVERAAECEDRPIRQGFVPKVGDRVRILDAADGSGCLARGRFARIARFEAAVARVEVEGGRTEEMRRVRLHALDLHPDEYRLASEGES